MESPLAAPPALLAVGLLLLAYWAYRDVVWRRTKQFAGWPQLKPSLAWGHAVAVNEHSRKLPPNCHPDDAFRAMREELGNPPVFITDFRPFAYPMLMVCTGFMAEQLSRATKASPYSAPKSPTLGDFTPLIGHQSILMQEGEEWKKLRRHMNPGFAPKHLLTLLSVILDKTDFFLCHLDDRARSGEAFELHQLTVNLTFDIIGAVVADADFAAQQPDESRQSPILKDYKALIGSFKSPAGPGLDKFNLPLMARRWFLARRLHRLIKAHVKAHFAATQGHNGVAKRRPSSRSVLALGIEGAGQTTDDAYIDMICDQVKSFLFAGHDTTSVALQWAFYEIYRRPAVLAALRAELDAVFGPGAAADPTVVRDRLLAPGGEEIMSRLPYMSAVMKETLRLYPPASTARLSTPGTRLTMPDGTQTPPLDGLIIYIAHYLVQRDRDVYGENADEFVPERWLGNTDTHATEDSGAAWTADEKPQQQGSGIPASSWRPFERGPRNCIGQELANIEFRVILACTVARYEFEKVGLGEFVKDASGNRVLNSKGCYETKSNLYNVMEVTAKPADGTMMKIRLSKEALSRASRR